MKRMFTIFVWLSGALGAAQPALAADTWPVRPIRMIVAYPPGGGTDQVGRLMADQLTQSLGQNVILDNRGGATGNIGTELAARAVAVTTAKRSQAMPELPTIAEAGVTGYEASTWYGLLAPAKTPKPIIDRLHVETVKILAGPARQRLEVQGFEPIGGTPAEFSAHIKSEIVKWAKVIKDANIPAE